MQNFECTSTSQRVIAGQCCCILASFWVQIDQGQMGNLDYQYVWWTFFGTLRLFACTHPAFTRWHVLMHSLPATHVPFPSYPPGAPRWLEDWYRFGMTTTTIIITTTPKILKRYIHRSFLNSNYSSITSQKLFANKNIKDYHILPHSFHKITSTYHFHYLIHFSKSSVPTISLPHSFSQNHHSQFITPSFIFTKSSQLIMSSSRSFH